MKHSPVFSLRGSPLASFTLIFAQATAAWAADTSPPQIEHERVQKAPLGQPLHIKASIIDESEIFAPTLYVRAVGQENFVSIEMTRKGDLFLAMVPAEQMAGDIEYFIEAFDEHGNGPAREGSPEVPLLVPTFDASLLPPSHQDALTVQTETNGDSVTDKWWFWTLLGVAVSGGVTTAIVLAAGGGGADEVSVIVRGPDPSGVLK